MKRLALLFYLALTFIISGSILSAIYPAMAGTTDTTLTTQETTLSQTDINESKTISPEEDTEPTFWQKVGKAFITILIVFASMIIAAFILAFSTVIWYKFFELIL